MPSTKKPRLTNRNVGKAYSRKPNVTSTKGKIKQSLRGKKRNA